MNPLLLLFPLPTTTTVLLLSGVLLFQHLAVAEAVVLPQCRAASSLPAATLTLKELLATLSHEETAAFGGGTAAVASGEGGGSPGGGESR